MTLGGDKPAKLSAPGYPERITVRIPVAAAMLGVGRTKLYEFIGQGHIKAIKLGKVTVIAIRDLEAFVERQRATTATFSDPLKRRGRPTVRFTDLTR